MSKGALWAGIKNLFSNLFRTHIPTRAEVDMVLERVKAEARGKALSDLAKAQDEYLDKLYGIKRPQ